MNLDDLKQTLASMADDVRVHDAAGRVAGVNDKIRAARRRKAAGAGAGVAAVAAVLAFVVPNVVSGGPAQRPNPAGHGNQIAHRPPGRGGFDATVLPTVTDKGAEFYRAPGGDTLIGEAVGSPGQTSVTLTVTPRTSDLSYVGFCWQPRTTSATAVRYNASVNGNPYVGSDCGSDRYGPLQPEGRFSRDPRVNANGWKGLGVTAGKPMTVTLAVPPHQRQLARSERVQLGLGLYANTGPTVQDHGVTIPLQAVFAGHAYQLVDRQFKRFAHFRGHLELPLPPAGRPLLTMSGVQDVNRQYLLNGADGSLNKSDAGGASQVGGLVRQGQTVARVSIRSPKDPRGLLYVLIYRQAG